MGKQQYQLDFYREGCYDDATEILTREGWKLFADLGESDEVATRSPAGQLEWQAPADRQCYWFDRQLLEFRSGDVDLRVTPNHRMLVTSADSDGKIVPAESLAGCDDGQYGVLTCGTLTSLDDPDPEFEWAVPLPRPVMREYHGNVYCVTVPNGVVYVRRNGRPVWCGNSIPGMFVSPGDVNMTPSQIRELQDALNALAGDVGFKHKIIVLPPGSKTDPQKPPQLADQFDEVVQVEVCMAFTVQPMELGISPKVSSTQSSGAANQMAKASRDTHERKSLVPTLQWLKQNLLDKVLQVVCKQDDMQFTFEGLEEDEDEESLTGLLVQQVGAGLSCIDEARAELGKDPWGIPVTSDPLWASATGVVPLGAMDPETGQPKGAQPPPPGQAPPPGAAPGEGGSPPGKPPPTGPGSPGGGTPGAKPSGGTGNAGQSPGHEAAEAGADVHTDDRGQGGASKAALAELGALERHLNKGRDIATWQPRAPRPGSCSTWSTAGLADGPRCTAPWLAPVRCWARSLRAPTGTTTGGQFSATGQGTPSQQQAAAVAAYNQSGGLSGKPVLAHPHPSPKAPAHPGKPGKGPGAARRARAAQDRHEAHALLLQAAAIDRQIAALQATARAAKKPSAAAGKPSASASHTVTARKPSTGAKKPAAPSKITQLQGQAA